jgi:putative oxidoreductase
MSSISNSSRQQHDAALLGLRLVVGLTFAHFGLSKLLGGTAEWNDTGSAMLVFGISFGHVFFGFLAAVIEFLGGLLLALGVFARLSAFALTLVMLVATATKVSAYSLADMGSAADLYYPLTVAAACATLALTGPGRFRPTGQPRP